MLPGMQLIGTTPPKQNINNGPVLQQCAQEMLNLPQGGKGMLDRTPTDPGSKERELQVDEVVVKLVTLFFGG